MSRCVLCGHWYLGVNLMNLSLKDKAQPETQAHSFGNVAFNAFLAVDDPGALVLVRQSGADGFRMDSAALFQVSVHPLKKILRVFYQHFIWLPNSALQFPLKLV